MEWLFVNVAMSLDTLPNAGRVMLLAVLLAAALFGLSKKLPVDPSSSVHVLYGKGALSVLLLVPIMVYLLGLKLPVLVPPSEFRTFTTPLPGYITLALLGIWLVGALWRVFSLLRSVREQVGLSETGTPLPTKLQKRIDHWRSRLAIGDEVVAVSGGSELGWHTRGSRPAIHIPTAAVNWPMGLFDVLLLQQLAQIKQNAWRWLLFGRFVQALYWPLPWVGRLVDAFSSAMVPASVRLAESAYRDIEGWQRDARNFNKRADTLLTIEPQRNGLRLETPSQLIPIRARSERAMPSVGSDPLGDAPGLGSTKALPADAAHGERDGVTLESKWADTKARRQARHKDPYEQAYWLIAAACVAVGIATTLTLVPASPEFEPRYLNVKWHEQMSRRLFDSEPAPRARELGVSDAEAPSGVANGAAQGAAEGTSVAGGGEQ